MYLRSKWESWFIFFLLWTFCPGFDFTLYWISYCHYWLRVEYYVYSLLGFHRVHSLSLAFQAAVFGTFWGVYANSSIDGLINGIQGLNWGRHFDTSNALIANTFERLFRTQKTVLNKSRYTVISLNTVWDGLSPLYLGVFVI